MTSYYGVIGNRDHIKVRGERRPFWEFLDRQPDGWLTSLVYARAHDNLPETDAPMIWDCGAWSYRDKDVPKIGRNSVTPHWAYDEYRSRARPGDLVVAPDHMLIESFGKLDDRRAFNRASAEDFMDRSKEYPVGLVPMAVVHGLTVEERLQHAEWLNELGYRAIALGGLAGRASAKRSNIEIVREVRQLLPDVWLHVLGLSSPDYARAWYQLGVNSFDGASHFKQAFTGGTFFTEDKGKLTKHKAARTDRETKELVEEVTAPLCHCTACSRMRDEEIDTRTYGSNENNMGRAAHNLNMLMRAHEWVMRDTWVLVSCVGKKRESAAEAQELYQSSWFLKARAYAEQRGDKWAILSAAHGIVLPHQVLAPYEQTLNDMGADDRWEWALETYKQIRARIPPNSHIVILAGRRYREHLLTMLEEDYTVEVPMEGLGIGQQLRWLDDNTKMAYVQSTLF